LASDADVLPILLRGVAVVPASTLLPFAFVAGAAACLNPCGFALLPAYVAYFVGRGEPGSSGGFAAGLQAGAGMTAGVLTVFGAVGGLLSAVGYAFMRFVPLAAMTVGALVALAGLVMLLRPSFTIALRVGDPLPGRTSDRTWRSFLLFGAGYGIASLGCTLPIFLVVVTQALAAGGALEGFGVFVAYGLGMGAVLAALSVAVAVGKGAVIRWVRGWTAHLRTAGALGMVVAGAYLIYVQISLGGLAMSLGQ
jgi:cytochrome c-type biogenesis protein